MITVFVSAKRRAIIATIATKRTISVARTSARGKSENVISVAISVVIEIATVVAIGVAIDVATQGVISVIISIVSLSITTVIAIAIATGSATIVAIGVATVNATGITQDELKEVGVKKTRKYLIYAFLCFFVF